MPTGDAYAPKPVAIICAILKIYLLVLMAYFHKNKWTSNVLTAVLFSVISYLMFTKLLGVNLARGILPF